MYWRLGPFEDDWRILEKLIDKIPKINISKEKKFTKEALNSRLIIHVDIQTTFLETMFMNIPSVILAHSKFWNVSKKSALILKKLKDANILFYNYEEMVDHINKNYSNLDKWWESKKVQAIRSNYLRHSGAPNSNSAKKEWFDFIKKFNK